MGYARAGFEVVGVDNRPQPRYPFEFHQGDAMTWPLDGFDVIHASPPCQDHSSLKVNGLHGTGWMLGATLERLAGQPAFWVVENVSTAKMRADFLLCGQMFGLQTVRHRRFALDPRFPALLAVPPHEKHRRPSWRKQRVAALANGDYITLTGNGWGKHFGAVMGIDWMNGNEIAQAIPPAYTEFIGAVLLDEIRPASAIRVRTPPQAG